MKLQSLMTAPFVFAIRFYQIAISPFLGARCRFHPSCSHYALDALKQHPFPYALWLTIKRIIRCQPWCHGGVDYVPAPANAQSKYLKKRN